MSPMTLVRDLFAPLSTHIMDSMQRIFLEDVVLRMLIVSSVGRVGKISRKFLCDFENGNYFNSL